MNGERLKKLRQDRRISQNELSEIMNVTQNAISKWERGERDPDTATLKKLADYFNVSTDYLLGVDDKKNTPSVINRKVLDVYDKLSDEARLKLLSYCDDLLGNPKNLK